jgi:hypothetical protein
VNRVFSRSFLFAYPFFAAQFLCAKLALAQNSVPLNSRLSIAVGAGALSGGDDYLRPMGWSEMCLWYHWCAQAHAYGEREGIVSQYGQLYSVVTRFPMDLWQHDRFFFSGGVSLMRNVTVLRSYKGSQRESETSHAIGAALNFSALLFSLGPVSFDFHWNTHLYPAGYATIFLVTSRRQALLMGLRWEGL